MVLNNALDEPIYIYLSNNHALDDVIKWKHFSHDRPFVMVPGELSLQKVSDAELWCFLWSKPGANGSANN